MKQLVKDDREARPRIEREETRDVDAHEIEHASVGAYVAREVPRGAAAHDRGCTAGEPKGIDRRVGPVAAARAASCGCHRHAAGLDESEARGGAPNLGDEAGHLMRDVESATRVRFGKWEGELGLMRHRLRALLKQDLGEAIEIVHGKEIDLDAATLADPADVDAGAERRLEAVPQGEDA